MHYSKFPTLLVCALCLAGFAGIPAVSAEESGEPGSPQAAADSSKTGSEAGGQDTGGNKDSGNNSEPGKVLHGGVRGSAVRLEEGLNMIEASSGIIQNSALELAKECTRKETAVMRGPNYIGNGIVIPALGGDGTGMVQAGELPARKDRVDAFVSSAEDGMKALRTHVDGLIIPEGSSQDLMNLWRGMQSSMKAADGNISAMREMVAQVPVKKGEIKQKDAKSLGRAAMKVYDSMTALKKMRDQIDDMIKPEVKK